MTATDTRPAAGPVLLDRWEAGSPEWHAARANGLGGSEIAAVLGLSKWESRFSLWHRKAGRIAPQGENVEMEWGKRLEPIVAAKFVEEHPELVARIGGTFRHPHRPWQIANPDLLLGPACSCTDLVHRCEMPDPTAVLEVKTALYADEWGEPGTDEIPPYYLAQCRWYLDVLGLDTCHVAVLIGGHEYREYVVRPDADDTATMLAAATEFIASLRTCDRPDIDQHGATYQAVRQLHPDIDPIDVELPADVAAAYITALLDERTAKAAKTKASALVLDAIGTARRGMDGGECIAMRVPGRGDNPPFLRPARGLLSQEDQS